MRDRVSDQGRGKERGRESPQADSLLSQEPKRNPRTPTLSPELKSRVGWTLNSLSRLGVPLLLRLLCKDFMYLRDRLRERVGGGAEGEGDSPS